MNDREEYMTEKYTEVIVRMFDNYADLWFKNEFIEYMQKNKGVGLADILVQFKVFKENLIKHLIEDIKLDSISLFSFIERIVEEKHDEHLKAVMSRLT